MHGNFSNWWLGFYGVSMLDGSLSLEFPDHCQIWQASGRTGVNSNLNMHTKSLQNWTSRVKRLFQNSMIRHEIVAALEQTRDFTTNSSMSVSLSTTKAMRWTCPSRTFICPKWNQVPKHSTTMCILLYMPESSKRFTYINVYALPRTYRTTTIQRYYV